jgi:hypothetical protein
MGQVHLLAATARFVTANVSLNGSPDKQYLPFTGARSFHGDT